MKIKKQKSIIYFCVLLLCVVISNFYMDNTKPREQNVEVDKKIEISNKENLEVHYIDVGQADSILLKQGENTMLIDGGNNDDALLVENYLKKNNVSKIDYVIATHPHEDHIGGLDHIVNSFDVKKVYAPKVNATTKTYKDFVLAVKNKNLKFSLPKNEEKFMLGNAECEILGPIGQEYEETNNYSIVLKVTYKNKSFLFTGDAEGLVEKELINYHKDKLNVDVLKLGHHGSSSSTTNEFLNIVTPDVYVAMVGKDNKYGHPHKSTLDKLTKNNVKLYRTDLNSNIVIITDGESLNINTN